MDLQNSQHFRIPRWSFSAGFKSMIVRYNDLISLKYDFSEKLGCKNWLVSCDISPRKNALHGGMPHPYHLGSAQVMADAQRAHWRDRTHVGILAEPRAGFCVTKMMSELGKMVIQICCGYFMDMSLIFHGIRYELGNFYIVWWLVGTVGRKKTLNDWGGLFGKVGDWCEWMNNVRRKQKCLSVFIPFQIYRHLIDQSQSDSTSIAQATIEVGDRLWLETPGLLFYWC